MNKEDILNIINQGESETVEFKTSFNKAVIETIVAFSNHKGGKIIIGVNNKKIVGLSLGEETIQKWINEIKQNTEQDLSVLGNGLVIILISILILMI